MQSPGQKPAELDSTSEPRPTLHRVRLLSRAVVNPWRLLPSFLIIGAQRSGTSSLFNYLAKHPSIRAPIRKEIHYFSTHHDRGENWYRAHFPTRAARRSVTFEATPYYLFHPLAPNRAYATVPEARLIALLRDPIDRAFSQYQLNVSRGREERPFELAIEGDGRVDEESALIRQNPNYRSSIHQNLSYIERGQYAEQLERWFTLFPRDRFLITDAESFFRSPAQTYRTVLAFLGLFEWLPEEFPALGYRTRSESLLDAKTRRRLSAYYRPHNQRLFAMLGREFNWG